MEALIRAAPTIEDFPTNWLSFSCITRTRKKDRAPIEACRQLRIAVLKGFQGKSSPRSPTSGSGDRWKRLVRLRASRGSKSGADAGRTLLLKRILPSEASGR